VLALTGSIGMGKSTATRALRQLGVLVHDADAEVHWLLREDRATIAAVEAAFPGVVCRGVVDRAELGRRVFGDPALLERLEGILHPRVGAMAARFLRRAKAMRRRVVAFDIPLLFETGGETRFDVVIVVNAPEFVRDARVLTRRSMSRERLAAILARQLPEITKARRADFIVPTGLDRRTGLRALGRIVRLHRSPRNGRSQARRVRRHHA
jgi:dephospho-CoA kinase